MLGRVIRDIQRKCPEPYPKLKEELKQAQRIYDQQRKDKGKVYSVHAPEVERISKGKAHKRYEFGVKVSVGTSSRGGWHMRRRRTQAIHMMYTRSKRHWSK